MKLSKTQLAMLERLGTGDSLIEHHCGPDVFYAWSHDYQTRGMRSATVYKLLDVGLVSADSDWKGKTFTISAKGKAYLEELQCNEPTNQDSGEE